MKQILNILLLITSLFGYLEWGKNNHAFLYQVEYDLIFNRTGNTDSFTHPFVLIPMLGQLMIIISLFQKQPNKTLTITGMCFIGILLLFLFIIGALSMNTRIAGTALPFLVTAVLVLINYWKTRKLQAAS